MAETTFAAAGAVSAARFNAVEMALDGNVMGMAGAMQGKDFAEADKTNTSTALGAASQ